MDFFYNNWFWLAFVAPFLWAWVNILDNYFVDTVYSDAVDGTLISGLFQVVPLLGVLFGIIDISPFSFTWAGWALAAGFAFNLSLFFYFKTLFTTNDTVLTQVLWNVSILLVPLIAWFVLGERLIPRHYVGIGLAFVGSLVLIGDYHKARRGDAGKILWYMGVSILLLSLSLVLSKVAYIREDAFWSVFVYFSLGSVLCALAVLVIDRHGVEKRLGSIYTLSQRFFGLFLFAEVLQLVGVLTSQRAVNLSPSPSFIVVVESFLPAFVLLNSFLLFFLVPRVYKERFARIYQEQFVGLPAKIVAIFIMSAGVYLIS